MKNLFTLGRRMEQYPFDNDHLHGICSMIDFHFILMRERSRVDRNNGSYSLVVLDLYSPPSIQIKKRLIGAILARIRISDSAGWLNDTSIGILLVDTACPGGHAFLDDLLGAIPDMSSVVQECHVFTYPPDSHQYGSGKGSGERFLNSTTSPRDRLEIPDLDDVLDDEETMNNDRAIHEILSIRPTLSRRIAECILAAFILLLISPLMLAILIGIRINSPGPSLYRQTRIGHKGQPFECYKFRTMHPNVDLNLHDDYFKQLISSNTPMKKLDKTGDPRIFLVGRWLRASSLDELPQLFNILRGEMSLIGPRPALPVEYNEYLPWQRHRIDTLPGLTGLWQVNGKNKTTFTEMMRFDLHYTRHQSLWMDARIILRTIPVVIEQFLEDRPIKKSDRIHHFFSRRASLYANVGPLVQPAIQQREQQR